MANKWYDIKAKGDDSIDITINGIIGWEVSAVDILNSLAGKSFDKINLSSVYSPGGSLDDGLAIYNALRHHADRGAEVTATGNTLVASSASLLFMAADTRIMPENSYMMIHDPWAGVIGNPEELREAADFIDERADKMAALYSERTGTDADTIREWMIEEKYMDGEQAVDLGFATELSSEVKLAALSKDHSQILKNAPSAICGHKMNVDNVHNERHLEKFLREAGVSKRDATALVAKAKLIYGGEPRKDEPELDEVLSYLKEFDFGKLFEV